MTRREAGIVVIFLAAPIFIIGLLVVIALIVAVMPREQTRQLRHKLSKGNLWQWSKHGRLSAVIHGWLWKNGNGH